MSGANQFLLECPVCRAKSLVTGGAKIYCPPCGYEADGTNGAADWVNNVLGIVEQPGHRKRAIHECPACKKETLVAAGSAGGSAKENFICFSCGSRWQDDELLICQECSRLWPADEFEELIICRSSVGFYVCHSCYEKVFK